MYFYEKRLQGVVFGGVLMYQVACSGSASRALKCFVSELHIVFCIRYIVLHLWCLVDPDIKWLAVK